jgi:hypothetical protein
MFRASLAHLQEGSAQTTLGILRVCCELDATRIGVELVSPTPVPLQYNCHLCRAF